jgi:hypothetical protein
MVSIKNRNLIQIIAAGFGENSLSVYLELELLYPPGSDTK